VVASGDSDFSPLVSKLKENNKYVIGVGVKNSTSDLLIENCDEFIFYEDLVRGQQPLSRIANIPEKLQECFALLVDAVIALQRENKEILWGSMVKETMKRKKPSFNETYYGFRSYSQLLEDAQRRGIVALRRDQRSGSYIVEDLGPTAVSAPVRTDTSTVAFAPRPAAVEPARPAEPPASTPTAAEASDAANGRPTRRRRGRMRRPRTAPPGPDAGTTPWDGEGDEEDLAAEPAAEPASAPAATADGDAPAEHGEPTPPPEEKGGFSLFSWIRRETPPKPPDTPPSTPGEGESSE